jgi:glyoxylase-like metal-dependent hydrolase (beta-lactamase superfamily II)
MSATKTIASMEKIEIRQNIYQYLFIADNATISNSIFVCIDKRRNKAIIIDTAYPEMAELVKRDLSKMGIEPEMVILSHYHPDHAAGCTVFSGLPIYASEHYKDNHFNSQRWEPEYTYLKPTQTLRDGDKMSFGPHQIDFIYAPGHCKCLMMIHINRDVLYIADLMMYDPSGKKSLPFVSIDGNFKEHIQYLEKIKTIDYNTLLVTHGQPLNDKETIETEILDRVYYLQRTLNSKGSLPLASCLKEDIVNYSYTSFHDTNIVQLLM